MSDKSGISWTDSTWPIVVGCERVSRGCERCYAEQMSARLAAMGQATYAGLTRRLPSGGVRWSGVVRTLPERLDWPLKWRKPRRVFVTSMGDLFHADVPDEFLDKVFAVMAATPQHTYQVLTKRPERMLAYLSTPDRDEAIGWAATDLYEAMNRPAFSPVMSLIHRQGYKPPEHLHGVCAPQPAWPPPNVWLGVSVEDQGTADERIPLLLQTPAAVRFLSCEPLLGPVDLSKYLSIYAHEGPPCCAERTGYHRLGESVGKPQRSHIDWVIVGGESGPDYRPMQLEWLESLVDQCRAAGVAVWVKQDSSGRSGQWGRIPERLRIREFPTLERR